jgi:hypothetical protein
MHVKFGIWTGNKHTFALHTDKYNSTITYLGKMKIQIIQDKFYN